MPKEVVTIKPDGSAADLDSPVFFREWFRELARRWGAVLNPAERSIVWMVFDRTLGWGKDREWIPWRHFTGGVVAASGHIVHPGTGLSRATVARHLARLIERGAVLRFGRCVYGLNFEWRGPEMELRKSVQQDTDGPSKGLKLRPAKVSERDSKGLKLRPHKRRERKEEKKIREAGASLRQHETLGEALSDVESRSQRRVEQGKARVSRRIPGAAEVGRLWVDAVVESFPGELTGTLTRKTIAVLRQYATRFCRQGGEEHPFADFSNYMSWVVQNWRLIVDNRLHWTDNPALVPDVLFFVGLSTHFERAWTERRRVEAYRAMTPREAYRQRLIDSGRTEEVADRATEERFRRQDQSAARQRAPSPDRLRADAEAVERRKRAAFDLERRKQAVAARVGPGPYVWRDE
ncbi:hypothetical protein ACFLSJ_00350 [Verrucomicrobiota bacterium]